MKLHRWVYLNEAMCCEQGRHLSLFSISSNLPLPGEGKGDGREVGRREEKEGHNSRTLRNFFMELHRWVYLNDTMCLEQGRRLSLFYFSSIPISNNRLQCHVFSLGASI